MSQRGRPLLPQLALLVVALVAGTPTAHGATVVLPLPELIGEYPDRRARFVDIDLGTPFVRIDEVRLHVVGTLVQGLAGNLLNPETRVIGALFTGQFEPQVSILDRPTAYAGSIADGPFESEGRFHETGADAPPIDFGFLLDGESTLIFRFSPGYLLMTEYVIVRPFGSVSEAALIVDGAPVPEPTALVLLGLGLVGLAVLRRR